MFLSGVDSGAAGFAAGVGSTRGFDSEGATFDLVLDLTVLGLDILDWGVSI